MYINYYEYKEYTGEKGYLYNIIGEPTTILLESLLV